MLHGLGNACYAINKHVNNACDEAYCQQNRTDDIQRLSCLRGILC